MQDFNIDNLTIGQLKEIQRICGASTTNQSTGVSPIALLRPGQKVFIRTVTLYYTGEIVQVTAGEIELKDAAWIADTKRFADFLKDGPQSGCEIEPYPDGVVLNRDVILDISAWRHALPRKQQ